MKREDKMEKLRRYAETCEEATKKINAKFIDLKAKHKKLKKDMKVLEERQVKRARLDPATIAKIMIPEKIRPNHVRVEKQKKLSTFSIKDLRDVETVFRALGSSSAQTIADRIFDLLFGSEKETGDDPMKRLRSCIDTLRSRSESSLKRYALERMLWELRKRIVRRLFSSLTTTCPVRLFSAYVSVSSVEDTADITINCLRYLHFSNETRARICRKAVKMFKSLRLSGLIVRVVLCVLDPYADSETERSNVVVKDEELVSVLRKYISSSHDIMSLEEFVWRKRCCYDFSSTNNEYDHDTIIAALQIMALSKGFFWAYNKFVRELLWKTIKEGEELQSIRAVRLLGDLCQVLFLDDPNGTGRCIVDIRNSLSSLLNENDTTIVRSRTWCCEIRYVLKNLWPCDLDDFFVHVLRSELKSS
eukprot:g4896.t1